MTRIRRTGHRAALLGSATLTTALALALTAPAPMATAAAASPRVDLRVLVVDDGGPATAAIADELRVAGTPFTTVKLADAGRPVINAAFLADTVDGRPRAKFQAVVLPNDNPFGDGSAEMAALAAYETTYSIPQVDAYTYARPAVGLDTPDQGGYAGSLDGRTAQVTTAGKAGAFGYLDGAVPFEDNAPTVNESWGYAAKPATGADFTSYVDVEIPGATGQRGSLLGEYRHDGRRELVVTFVYNQYQQQFRLLARGIVNWMTDGVLLGADRNYFAVHVDDVFATDDRWDSTLNCTPGDVDCPPGQGQQDGIRMSVADAQHAAQWSRQRGLTLDMVYNGGGSDQFKLENNNNDPLLTQLQADKSAYRWVNHTYDHPFLGCEQNISVVPWVCAKNADGSTKWITRTEISQQIRDNRTWGQRYAFPLETGELVTGEHSGLALLPQQPTDNPNLAGALTDNSVTSLASDNSRESTQRQVGPALTVPRYPMNIFYNAGRVSDQVDEYNWIYTRKSQGGSGICETAAHTTCLDAPLDPATGFQNYIVPLEKRIALGHVLSNDPRPHFIHQSNLAEDRIAFPVLDGVLDQYAALYADNTPLVNLRQKDIGDEMKTRAAWNAAVAANQVTAYRIDGTVTIQAPSGVRAAATMPAGTRKSLVIGSEAFGSAYAGRTSGWASPGVLQDKVTLTLPTTAVTALKNTAKTVAAAKKSAAPARKPAQRLPLPQGVVHRVPYGVTAR
ncbi:hypothetical protein ABT160_14335 [Streptomyces sp. NPDC001941]|uniref:hypothetical protein n=1 Tax=Streptomyces sp. NPDC001941 TaxID=3154659 RepID=UPI003326F8E5